MELLSRAQAARRLTVHPNTFDRFRREPDFPKPLHIGRVLRWRSDQIHDWIERRTAAEPDSATYQR